MSTEKLLALHIASEDKRLSRIEDSLDRVEDKIDEVMELKAGILRDAKWVSRITAVVGGAITLAASLIIPHWLK